MNREVETLTVKEEVLDAALSTVALLRERQEIDARRMSSWTKWPMCFR